MTRLALITGGSRGIGKATADMLRERGWDVLAPTRGELNIEDNQAAGAYAGRWTYAPVVQPLDALILNASGWYSLGPENRMYATQFSVQQGILNNHMKLFWELLGVLQLAHGVVIGVSSTQAFQGTPETASYSVAKAGLINLMGAFAKYYDGVRFNSIAPGWTDTDMGKKVKASGGVSDPDAVPQPPEVVAAEIVRLIESEDTGRVMRIVDSVVEEWAWGPKR